MSYGSTAYGSAALGGSAASEWYTFFVSTEGRPVGDYEATVIFGGEAQWFSLFAQQANDTLPMEYKAYISNDLGETPQLAATFGGRGQTVIPAARFIKVIASVLTDPEIFNMRGRPGD